MKTRNMDIQETTDPNTIDSIKAAPRSMVILSVPWSGPERVARADFRKAVNRLQQIGLLFSSFVLDEESEICQQWLATLGLPAP